MSDPFALPRRPPGLFTDSTGSLAPSRSEQWPSPGRFIWPKTSVDTPPSQRTGPYIYDKNTINPQQERIPLDTSTFSNDEKFLDPNAVTPAVQKPPGELKQIQSPAIHHTNDCGCQKCHAARSPKHKQTLSLAAVTPAEREPLGQRTRVRAPVVHTRDCGCQKCHAARQECFVKLDGEIKVARVIQWQLRRDLSPVIHHHAHDCGCETCSTARQECLLEIEGEINIFRYGKDPSKITYVRAEPVEGNPHKLTVPEKALLERGVKQDHEAELSVEGHRIDSCRCDKCRAMRRARFVEAHSNDIEERGSIRPVIPIMRPAIAKVATTEGSTKDLLVKAKAGHTADSVNPDIAIKPHNTVATAQNGSAELVPLGGDHRSFQAFKKTEPAATPDMPFARGGRLLRDGFEFFKRPTPRSEPRTHGIWRWIEDLEC